MTRVDVEEFARRIQQGDPIVLDVRTPDEFASGHIPGAINLDIHSPSFTEELRRLDRDQSYLVYCRSGRRSARACGLMAAEGFHRLHDLSPGFNGWKSAGEAVGR